MSNPIHYKPVRYEWEWSHGGTTIGGLCHQLSHPDYDNYMKWQSWATTINGERNHPFFDDNDDGMDMDWDRDFAVDETARSVYVRWQQWEATKKAMPEEPGIERREGEGVEVMKGAKQKRRFATDFMRIADLIGYSLEEQDQPIDILSVKNAIHILADLPKEIVSPEIGLGPNGGVRCQWESKDMGLDVSLWFDEDDITMYRRGGGEIHATPFKAFGENPKMVKMLWNSIRSVMDRGMK